MVKTFNLTIPRREDLRCMVCKIVSPTNDPMIRYPDYCRNKFKYRRFLDEIPEAMAAPKNFEEGSIYVIVAKDLFEKPTFRYKCSTLEIEIPNVEQHHPIFDSIYEKCLYNTVKHKLLLQWNGVGRFLVEGLDFLNSMRSVDAIRLTINIRDNNAQFHMEAFNLQIPFLQGSEGCNFQLPPLVNVLPSLVKAKALKRWEAIQEAHPFANYEDLREYWKKMHGYTLPVNEEGLLFYDVQFFQGTSIMVHPEICLTIQDLTTSRLENDNQAATRIYENFFEDLKGGPYKVTTLCGQELVYPEV